MDKKLSVNRYLRKDKKARIQFTKIFLSRTCNDDEARPKDAVKGKEAKQWKETMHKVIQTLQEMHCRKMVARPFREKVLHIKLIMKKKRDDKEIVQKYKTRLVVSGNEEEYVDLDSFAPMSDFVIVKMILCLAIRKGWGMRHINFQNAISLDELDRHVYAELCGTCM